MTDNREAHVLCLRPRIGNDGNPGFSHYPYWMRTGDVIRCHCGAASCADSFKPGETPYWLPTGEVIQAPEMDVS